MLRLTVAKTKLTHRVNSLIIPYNVTYDNKLWQLASPVAMPPPVPML